MFILAAALIIGIAIAVPISYSIAISGTLYLLYDATLPWLVIAQRMVTLSRCSPSRSFCSPAL